MRNKLVAANWKMNGRMDTVFNLLEPLVSNPVEGVDILIFPPAPYLLPAASIVNSSRVRLGGQNLCEQPDGAYTGEVSAGMLHDCGASYVLVGHSERRNIYAESNAQVAAKFVCAQQAGLVPILCVGESLEQREANAAESVIASQLESVIELAGIEAFSEAVIAYEPVWAIGTGRTATPEQAQEIHAFIRRQVAKMDKKCAESLLILYGGSVKADNAASLFSQLDIDGGLIGGASLDAGSFRAICQAAI